MTSAPTPTPRSGSLLPFFKISTVLEEPYVFREDQLDGTPRYSGFIIDILNELAGAAGFDYTVHLARDGTYGSMQRNGSWSGIIGDVQRGDADVAAGAITVTSAREKVVDFSKPFLSTGVQLLTKKPDRLWPGLGILVEPFTTELWFLILIFFIIVSFLMFLIGRFSPYEWGRVAAEGDKRGARYTLSLRNSFLLIFSSITWQGYREAPRSLSGRVLAAFWWIFSLFGIVAFTANLTAFLMARGESLPDMPFRNWRDLSKSDIRVGVLQGGSTLAQIQRTTIPEVNSLYVHIRDHNSFVNSYAEGIERVKEGNEKFVMLMESVTARYVASRNCELMVYGDNLFDRSLAFGCKKGSDICDRLSRGILKLREDGTMQLLFDKYWQGKCGETDWKAYAQKAETPIRAYAVSSRDLAVSFLLLFVGIVLAIVLLIAEIVIFKVWGTKEKPIPDIPKPIIKFPAKVPQFRLRKKGDAAAVTEVDETKTGEGTAAEGETDAGETTPLRSEGEPASGAAQSEQAQADEASPPEDQSAADSNEKKAEA